MGARDDEPGPERAALGDPGIYQAGPGEKVKVAGLRGSWKLIEYSRDHGGDFAVVYGGSLGHERCVTVDRVRRALRSRPRASTGTGGTR